MQIPDHASVIAVIPSDRKDWPPGTEEIYFEPNPDRTIRECEECGISCWIGPRQLELKSASPEIEILCINCIICRTARLRESGQNVQNTVLSLGGI